LGDFVNPEDLVSIHDGDHAYRMPDASPAPSEEPFHPSDPNGPIVCVDGIRQWQS
jgi:hypothetical protein